MQSRSVREGSVGLLIFLGLGSLLGIALWLRGMDWGGRYTLDVELSDALGLNVGSAVKYRGIKVGQVRTLTPSLNGVLAQVEIRPSSLVIPRGSVVEVTQSGFIGQVELSIRPKPGAAKIGLANPTPDTNLSPFKPKCAEAMILCDGDRLQGVTGANFDELIRATTKLADLLGDDELLANANTTLKSFSTTAKSLTQLSRNGTKTLRDVSGAANGFTSLSRDAQQELQHFGIAAKSVTKASNQVEQLGSQFGQTATKLSTAADQVSGLVQVNRSTLTNTLGNLQGASQDLKVAIKGLGPVLNRVEQGNLLNNLEKLAENGAKASESLKNLTNAVNNPATLLGLAQTLDSARVTFQNTQKITTDLEQVTGNAQFRQNLIKLINGLGKLVSFTQDLDHQVATINPVAPLAPGLVPSHTNTLNDVPINASTSPSPTTPPPSSVESRVPKGVPSQFMEPQEGLPKMPE